jgi:ASC-1-like (ASCH) protein
MRHIIKIREEFADAVLNGDKTFEVRFNDRGYQKGDTVKFRVVTGAGIEYHHPINEMEFEITYVLSGWGLTDGYVAFAIKRKEE